jgi:glycosyltransferase involved in cell wall biosynthesis
MLKKIANKKDIYRPIALLISIYFPPEPGGGSSAAWNRALILSDVGYRVFVICGMPSYPSGKVLDHKYKGKLFYLESMGHINLIRLRILPLSTSGYFNRFWIFLGFVFLSLLYMPAILRKTGRIELVYSIAPILFSSFCGFFYSKITKSFFVYEVSDIWPEELIVFETLFSSIILTIGKFVAKLSYMVPDAIIAISQLAADHISNQYKPGANIYVLPIGADPSRFQRLGKRDSRVQLIREKILPSELEDKFIILYSGLISHATRVDNLAYAAEKLKDNERLIAFLVVGEGEEKAKLQELKHNLSLNNLYLLPFQPRDLMPRIICAADVCTVSLPSEPIFDVDVPTKFYEYLACGKPQLGICGGEVAKIIESRKIGLTVTDGTVNRLVFTIKKLKECRELLEAMETNSTLVSEEFSLDNMVSKFIVLLKKEGRPIPNIKSH